MWYPSRSGWSRGYPSIQSFITLTAVASSCQVQAASWSLLPFSVRAHIHVLRWSACLLSALLKLVTLVTTLTCSKPSVWGWRGHLVVKWLDCSCSRHEFNFQHLYQEAPDSLELRAVGSLKILALVNPALKCTYPHTDTQIYT